MKFSSLFFAVEVPTGSMENTIQVNQQLLILKDECVKKYNRGDIVVFEHDGELCIKRLIAFPGETVRVTKGTVFIDGKLLFEEYLSSNTEEYDGMFCVEEGSYFLLGDNRANSKDARLWNNPNVEASDIKGKAIYYIAPKIEKVKEAIYE